MTRSSSLSGCQIFDAADLPSDWECIALKERMEFLYGRGLSEEVRCPGKIAVFGSNGQVGTHNVRWLDGPGLLVGRKGTVGAVHYTVSAYWPIDTVYYVNPVKEDQLRYLYYLLDYLPLKNLNAATGVPGLSRRDAYALRGAFPGRDEQAAIARILDTVDTAIECTREAVQRARELDHSLLHELLENGIKGGRKKGKPAWPIHRVDEVAEVGSGVTLGKDVSGFKHVELPYLRVANVQDGRLDLSTIKTVKVRTTDVDNYRLQPGDVLMTEGGDLDKLGRGTIWHGEIPNCLHQNHIFRIRSNRDRLRPFFFALVVESDIAKRYFLRVAKRTTNLASINKTVLRAFRFPVPHLNEQEQIENVMRAVKEMHTGLAAKERALQMLKKSLMHDLLTGRVRVNTQIASFSRAPQGSA